MKLLVPVDGSDASLRAVKFAISIARMAPPSEILLITVQNSGTLGLGELGLVSPAVFQKLALSAGAKALRKAIALCKAAKLKFSADVETGPIAETTIRFARQKRADQIVMGTRGLGGVRGLLLGSIATQIVHLATVPVTLVK
jgi:nucleotide-binding universal stress UspA family protein